MRVILGLAALVVIVVSGWAAIAGSMVQPDRLPPNPVQLPVGTTNWPGPNPLTVARHVHR